MKDVHFIIELTDIAYSALDANGQRVGKPLKSSLFGKSEGVARLEEKMQSSGEAIKSGKLAEGTKAAVSDALKASRTETRHDSIHQAVTFHS